MAAKLLISLGIVTSGVAILTALATVGFIFNDINDFHDGLMDDLGEFKLYANDAWLTMVAIPSSESSAATDSSSPKALFRGKRAAGGSCSCGDQPNRCPQGPPGPRGAPGEAGFDGDDGIDGNPGGVFVPESSNGYAEQAPACIQCPAGPRGPPGPDGPSGPAGPDGGPGPIGAPGRHGQPGAPGADGDAGRDGAPGSNGRPGAAGRNGKRGRGEPGAPGPVGPIGARGAAGARGVPGAHGAPGDEGAAGEAGRDGAPGEDGIEGEEGDAGLPGADGAYCPCPPRSSELVAKLPPAYAEEAAAATDAPGVASVGYRRAAKRS